MKITAQSSLVNRVLELAIAIQQIPAPTFEEGPRMAYLRQRFLELELVDVESDALGNLFARLPGGDDKPPLVVSAHLDTVFPAATELELVRTEDMLCGPGIGDNSLGLAGLFGLVWGLREQGIRLPGDLWLAANVGEEGLGDLRGMRAVVDRFGGDALAYIVLEGMALGQVYHRGLGVRRFRITVRTRGGHSWVDYGQPSAIHVLAGIITRLGNIDLPEEPRTTLNVGVIAGGTSVNTIASQASLELDLRSTSQRALDDLASRVAGVLRAAEGKEVQIDREQIGDRPFGELPAQHPLVRLAEECLEAAGLQARLNVGSTDANIPLSRGLPAVCLGVSTGGGAHTLNEYVNIPPIAQGLAQLLELIPRIYNRL